MHTNKCWSKLRAERSVHPIKLLFPAPSLGVLWLSLTSLVDPHCRWLRVEVIISPGLHAMKRDYKRKIRRLTGRNHTILKLMVCGVRLKRVEKQETWKCMTDKIISTISFFKKLSQSCHVQMNKRQKGFVFSKGFILSCILIQEDSHSGSFKVLWSVVINLEFQTTFVMFCEYIFGLPCFCPLQIFD